MTLLGQVALVDMDLVIVGGCNRNETFLLHFVDVIKVKTKLQELFGKGQVPSLLNR